jgi:tRNA(Ile)-lysidine synthase
MSPIPRPLAAAEFAARMAWLGPFSLDRRVAVAVSGGPDSMALAWLTGAWGQPLALVVDHGLRPDSAHEAALTHHRLANFNVPARVLRLVLPPDASAAAARAARYDALLAACHEAGLAHLLLGHQRGDQAETVLLRSRHASGPDGRAGISAWHGREGVALLRPLLDVPRGRLLATLIHAGVDWVEDPSNENPRAERARLRAAIAEPDGEGPMTAQLCAEASGRATRRNSGAEAVADWVARHADLLPGPAIRLPDGPWPPDVLRALVRLVAAADYPPSIAAVAELARAPRQATLAGTRLLRRQGAWWLAREPAAMEQPVRAIDGAGWDRRFRLHGRLPPESWLGALGPGTPIPGLPAAAAETLPAVRHAGTVVLAPHAGILHAEARIVPLAGQALKERFIFLANHGDALAAKTTYVMG